MIQMWDDLFSCMSAEIKRSLARGKGEEAFELMHQELDKVWKELSRVTKPGAFVCINIGDAARTIDNNFQLYSNHARIISSFKRNGFTTLPLILWAKTTNAPNKFMGSGMLPSGAYVTLEHEYILVFRRGGKRVFDTAAAKKKRMESAFFWEERNAWFSDTWNLKGVRQLLGAADSRKRSAAYPFELAYRLISMYSLREDLVLDPFLGTGTTIHAAIACGRNSIGVEIDENFRNSVPGDLKVLKDTANRRTADRVSSHTAFIADYQKRKGEAKYINIPHGFPVVTRQETELTLKKIIDIEKQAGGTVKARYAPYRPGADCRANQNKVYFPSCCSNA
jgi:DNA modification methylase